MTIIVFLAALFGAVAIGAPIAFALLFVGVALMIQMGMFDAQIIAQSTLDGADSFPLLAVPFFMLAGELMNQGGLSKRIVNLALAIVGHIRGGLGYVAITAGVIMASLSGSAVADSAALASLLVPMMVKAGHDKGRSCGLVAASGIIGPIIPPSIPMVIYGAMAEVSVGKLFLGGFVPGVMMGVGLMVLIYFFGFRESMPKDAAYGLGEIWGAFRSAFLSLLTPVILIGGILSGIFTPTEASAVAAVYAFVICFFIYKTVTWRDIPSIIVDTFVTTAVVTFIISATSGFSYLLIVGKIGTLLVESTLALTRNPWIILLIVNIALLILGCLMEAGVLLILLTPILVPMMKSLGVDLVHFGLVMVLNLMIGVATPPVGMCLFVVSGATGIKLERLMREVIPWVMPLIVVLFLITYFPSLVLTVPNWLMPGK